MPKDEVRASRSELNDLQLKILEGFWNRKPVKLIAADLGISEAWAHKNLTLIRRKLNVGSSADAAQIIFGTDPQSIRNYYYQETDIPHAVATEHEVSATVAAPVPAMATGEQALINQLGPMATLAGILLVSLSAIMSVSLLIMGAEGMNQLWKALGY